jgi:hypothetical protein
VQPRLVGCPVARTRDAVAELARHDDRDGRRVRPEQDLADADIPVDERRRRVGIEDRARSSGSMPSNVSPILAWMRRVSCMRVPAMPTLPWATVGSTET